MPDLRYPIGHFEAGPLPDANTRSQLLSQLADVPKRMRTAVTNLSDRQLDTPYRPGGWTVRQVVHHLADAQMNWYVRTKLAVTENEPTIKPFDEALWSELPDARSGPLESSLMLLDGVHQRWVQLFASLSEEQWMRKMIHPERGTLVLGSTLAMHVWHGKHHTAHIVELSKRMGW